MRVVLSADPGEATIAASSWCAANLAPGTTVTAVLGINPVGELMFGIPPLDPVDSERDLLAGVERDCCEPIAQAGLACVARLVPQSQARAILEVAGRERADLIVVGKRPHGWLLDVVLGDVAGHVVHHPPCPVLVVPAPRHHDEGRPHDALPPPKVPA
jgi:nucleotide-binding universal stress UspA family protein